MKVREEAYNSLRVTKKQEPEPQRSMQQDYLMLSAEEAELVDCWLKGHCDTLTSARAATFIKRYYN